MCEGFWNNKSKTRKQKNKTSSISKRKTTRDSTAVVHSTHKLLTMPATQTIAFSAVKVGMTADIKGQMCEITEVKVMPAKNANQRSKVKVVGKTSSGKSASVTKPEDRTITVSGSHQCEASSDEENASNTRRQSNNNSDSEDEELDCSVAQYGADASLTTPVRCGDLRKGSFVCLKGDKPCKVAAIVIVQPGKHGHTKANITGLDVFTGRKYVEVGVSSDHTLFAPVMKRSEWQITDMTEEGGLTLMDEGGNLREDLDLPTTAQGEVTELGERVESKYQSLMESASDRAVFVTVLDSMGTQQIVEFTTKEAC